MCGICGQFNFKDPEPVDQEVIRRMTQTMVHRGPDDEGYFFSGPLGLGFRRLSIIDLAGGQQPMADREQTVWVIFNGEIYNFPELKQELEGYGHHFQTRSDTEVIIHGYKQWGEDVFNHLNGMFGVAIWDERNKKLIIARDPMGIKLIYYKIQDHSVFFGSEIRPILAGSPGKPDIDPVALNLFLRYRYTPSPLTLFKEIKKLAPGTKLVIENGISRLERWYNFKPVPFFPEKKEEEATEELLEIYKKALKRHLLSDVPLGLLLSGGIDSGLLLGLMNLYGKSWPTFTIGYGKSFKDDELDDASATARIYSANHVSIELQREIFEDNLPKIVTFLEEPITSSSIVPMYFVCQRARQDVKVVLMGQGPDELFGGYWRHLGVRYGEYWRSLPSWVRKPLTRIIESLPRNETLKRGVHSLDIPERIKRYQHVFSIMPGEIIDGLFHDGMLPADAEDRVLQCWNGLAPLMENTDELGGLQFLEIRSSLPDELLMYADKLSMANGLEVRVPYLDREIAEYVERIPASFKIKKGVRKWLHRKICRNFLPKEILRRKKRGFATNIVDEWFQNSSSKKMENYFLDSGSVMYQFLQRQRVQQLLKEHIMKRSDNYKILSSLTIFEQWLRSFPGIA